jgi:hypothetical protein
MSAEYFNLAHLIVVIGTLVIVAISCLLHYEALRVLTRLGPTQLLRSRHRSLVIVLSLLCLHTLEIWLFGLGYWLLLETPASGELVGLAGPALVEFVYFSAVCYTTLGFGDVVPAGPIRFLVAMEGVSGLLLIAWSASYTYLQMEKYWQ